MLLGASNANERVCMIKNCDYVFHPIAWFAQNSSEVEDKSSAYKLALFKGV